MKRNKTLLAAGAFALLSLTNISCKKELEKNPYDQLSETESYNTPADFTAALNGLYNRMIQPIVNLDGTTKANNYLGGEDDFGWASSLDVLSDNVILSSTGRRSQQSNYRWQYTANTEFTTWEVVYRIVRQANAILENLPKLGDENTDFRNNVEGEALAVRGMTHFDLLRLYSKPVSGPTAAPSSPGVPYVTTTDFETNASISRGTVNEAYNKVVEDLVKAEGLIAMNNGTGRLNRAAVAGLLSRVYLYGGEWAKAEDAATRSLMMNGDVANIDEFPGIWTDDVETGVLFKVVITTQEVSIIGNAYNQASPDGIINEYVPDYEFYQTFSDDDIRKSSYFLTSEFSGIAYNSIIKYQGKTNGNLNLNDFKYLRVAEVLLNRMEARYRQGNESGALADLNELRENRYADFEAGTESGTELFNAIMFERRKELAFEGHRFFDLKRLGLPVQRSTFGDQADGSGATSTFLTLPAGDPRFQLPIFQNELNVNSNLVQNTGY